MMVIYQMESPASDSQSDIYDKIPAETVFAFIVIDLITPRVSDNPCPTYCHVDLLMRMAAYPEGRCIV